MTSVVSSAGTTDFYPRSPCGERPDCPSMTVLHCNFYPRSPCGERLHYDNYNLHCVEISIHALLAESDVKFKLNFVNQEKFLSTLSLRRATRSRIGDANNFIFLSTLSLRRATSTAGILRFDPLFLSTLSLRRATY